MDVHTHTSRAAAAIAAAALLVCTSTPAEAATTAKASSVSGGVGSGTWGAAASLKTAAPYGTGPLTLTFANSGTTKNPSFKPQYFTVGNTGTLDITAADYTAATTAPTSVQFVIDYCTGVWNVNNGTCVNGGSITVLTTPGGSSTTALSGADAPASPGTNFQFRATAIANGSVSSTVPPPTLTIGVTVTRAQARTATRTGS